MFKEGRKRPDFTIMIPTYNRSSFLKMAMESVLQQKGVSFELLVSDNCSPDDTKEVVKGFRDKRVRYIRNKKNLGYKDNAISCFARASGKYLFMLSDDDFILDENTLSDILKVMRKYKVAVARIPSIAYDQSTKSPYRTTILSDKEVVLKPKKDKNLILKSMDFDLGFFSGIVFDQSLIDKSRISQHMGYIYFPFAYDAILKHGMVFIPNHFIVAHLSLRFWKMYFDIEKFGSFYLEDLLPIVKEFTSQRELELYKKKYLRRNIVVLPSYKYFTSYKNYIKILQRYIAIDKTLLLNSRFYLYALAGFLPNFILKAVRDLIVYSSLNKVRTTLLKYDYSQKIGKLGFK